MGKQGNPKGRSRSKNAGSLGRPEHAVDDDRPFAEIRKNLHDALRILSLHRWAFFVPFCVVTCTMFVLSLYYPRTYRATTTFQRRNDPVMMKLPASAGAAAFKYFRSTILEDLTSPQCMGEIVESLGLTDSFERNEDGSLTDASRTRRDAIGRNLAGGLSVTTTSPNEHVDTITISYTGPDPKIGKRLVDEAKRTYIRRTMSWLREFLASQRDYFAREVEEALTNLKKAQREETRLRLENPHINPIDPGAITLKLAQLDMERRGLTLRKREYEGELSAQQQMLAALGPTAVAHTATSGPADETVGPTPLSPQGIRLGLQIQEVDRKVEQFKKARGMTDLHPEIQRLVADRRWLEGELDRKCQQDRDTIVSNTQLGLDGSLGSPDSAFAHALSSDQARIRVQIAAQKAKLKDVEISLETNELETGQLQQAKEQVYQKQEEFQEAFGTVSRARQQHQQLEATLASVEPAIKAVEHHRLLRFSEGQPARGSSRPISPKSMTIVLLALATGLAAGVAFVILAEIFDHVYRSAGQVARSLGLPLLESIDEIVTAKDRRSLFVRRAVVTPLAVICFVSLTGLAASMAYLSLEEPWLYQKVKKIPDTAIHLFAGETESDASSTG